MRGCDERRGRIAGAEASRPFVKSPDETMAAADIAAAYVALLAQPRTAWSQEFDPRPYAETF